MFVGILAECGLFDLCLELQHAMSRCFWQIYGGHLLAGFVLMLGSEFVWIRHGNHGASACEGQLSFRTATAPRGCKAVICRGCLNSVDDLKQGLFVLCECVFFFEGAPCLDGV